MERVTDERMSSLLQQYNSVEEALQDFRDGTGSAESAADDETSESTTTEEEVRVHTAQLNPRNSAAFMRLSSVQCCERQL